MAEWMQRSAGLLALLALAVSAAGLVFLLLIFARQKRAARRTDKKLEGVSRRLEDAGRAMVDRAEFSASTEAQSARLLQAMEERSRDEALRLSQLSARLDTFGDSQEARLHRISSALDEKLTQNEGRIERMRESVAIFLSSSSKKIRRHFSATWAKSGFLPQSFS